VVQDPVGGSKTRSARAAVHKGLKVC
jgi:hypothetical protein